MMIEVLQVLPHEDYTVHIYFSDGRIKLYDAKPLSNQGVFKKLSDPDFFIGRCTVLNRTLAWDVTGTFDATKCLDLDPQVLYDESVSVADPLQEIA